MKFNDPRLVPGQLIRINDPKNQNYTWMWLIVSFERDVAFKIATVVLLKFNIFDKTNNMNKYQDNFYSGPITETVIDRFSIL